MATRVNVTSVEAIESFRASLIIYLSKARPTLDEVNAEVVRLRIWMQVNQRHYWEGVAKKRARILEEAKANLFRSRLSNLNEVTAAEVAAVAKAQRAMNEADEKLRLLRRWERDFDNQTEPIARQLEKLQTFLADDLSKAVIYLSQTLATLNAYTGTITPGMDATAQPASPETTDAVDTPAATGALDSETKGAKS